MLEFLEESRDAVAQFVNLIALHAECGRHGEVRHVTIEVNLYDKCGPRLVWVALERLKDPTANGRATSGHSSLRRHLLVQICVRLDYVVDCAIR